MYRQPPPADPPKKTSPGRIVAMVGGALVLALLLVASAVYKIVDTKRALDDGFIAEAGPPMTDAEIRAALAGPKKDFVGHWSSVSGNAVLYIEADGRLSYSAATRSDRQVDDAGPQPDVRTRLIGLGRISPR